MPDRKGAGQEQKLLEGGALRSGVRCSKGGVTLSSENLTTSFKASRWHAECHSARFTVEPLSNPTPIGSSPDLHSCSLHSCTGSAFPSFTSRGHAYSRFLRVPHPPVVLTS